MKFRVWHTQAKEMIQGHKADIFLDLNGNVMEGHGIRSPHYIVMQSTKMRDKNEVEIFEGDLIKQNDRTFMVCWHFGGFWLCDPKDSKAKRMIHERNCEIVGNIYGT